MKTYIDNEFKCHLTDPNGDLREVVLSESASEFFFNKCATFIEGYRVKPDGETWIREDGKVFSGGEMITPWKPYDELDVAQRQYEREKLADAENALAIYLGGEV